MKAGLSGAKLPIIEARDNFMDTLVIKRGSAICLRGYLIILISLLGGLGGFGGDGGLGGFGDGGLGGLGDGGAMAMT